MNTRLAAFAVAAALMLSASPSVAQPAAPAATKPSTSAAAQSPSIVGTWIGTASVPLGDSTLTVPVTYTFTQAGTEITGTAVVPGQGVGAIGSVKREGARVTFSVTTTAAPPSAAAGAPPEKRVLEHEATIDANGVMAGIVNLDKKPLAKFRITQKPAK